MNLQARAPIGGVRGVGRLHIGATADNIFNGVVLPQLGLPLPGRMFRIGLQLD